MFGFFSMLSIFSSSPSIFFQKWNNINVDTKKIMRNNNINKPSGIIWPTEKNRINENDILESSITCHSPPNRAGNITIKLRLRFKKRSGDF